MRVGDLISKLEELEDDTEIEVSVNVFFPPEPHRPSPTRVKGTLTDLAVKKDKVILYTEIRNTP